MAIKKCAFCGKEYDTSDKSVILFRAKESGSPVRICSHCIEKCNELYQNKLAQDKIKAIETAPAILTPKEIKAKLDEWILDQDFAIKKISREYYNHLKRLKRYDIDNDANNKLRIDKSNMIYMGPTGSGKTETIRVLASFMNLPFVVEDCSSFTSSGYVG